MQSELVSSKWMKNLQKSLVVFEEISKSIYFVKN